MSIARPLSAVKVLLRHGASLEVVIAPPRVENSPIRCAAGSNALHIAALIGNISMAKLVLEAQEVRLAKGKRDASERNHKADNQMLFMAVWGLMSHAVYLPFVTDMLDSQP